MVVQGIHRHTKSMRAVFWILVRPVEIGPRCQPADGSSDSGHSLVLGLFEENEWEESIQMEDDVQVSGV
jgi:hypothetical protein